MASEHSDEQPIDWTWAAHEPEPTERERALLDTFAEEYLVDHDHLSAARRCGFMDAFADQYGKLFLGKSYVQRRIRYLRELEPDTKQEEAYNKRVVINTLREVATSRYSTAAARVAAANGLASIHGMAAPPKNANENHNTGGVVYLPVVANIDDWERAAVASQRALAEASRV